MTTTKILEAVQLIATTSSSLRLLAIQIKAVRGDIARSHDRFQGTTGIALSRPSET